MQTHPDDDRAVRLLEAGEAIPDEVRAPLLLRVKSARIWISIFCVLESLLCILLLSKRSLGDLTSADAYKDSVRYHISQFSAFDSHSRRLASPRASSTIV